MRELAQYLYGSNRPHPPRRPIYSQSFNFLSRQSHLRLPSSLLRCPFPRHARREETSRDALEMPFPTLLRRNRKSDINIRRHSSVVEPVQLARYVEMPTPVERVPSPSSDALPDIDAWKGAEASQASSDAGRPDDDGHLSPPTGLSRPLGFPGLARFRHASDSQLSARAKDDAGDRGTSATVRVAPPSSLKHPPFSMDLKVEKLTRWTLSSTRYYYHRPHYRFIHGKSTAIVEIKTTRIFSKFETTSRGNR